MISKSKHRSKTPIILFLLLILVFFGAGTGAAQTKTGNVIFIHPDGSGAAMWGALRLLEKGPDGTLNWDKMAHMGLYRGHLKDSTNSSSHGGATVHAFGVKVPYNTFGNDPQKPIISLSGKGNSIMIEAKQAGKAIALINSGHICEPGTAVFVSNAPARSMTDAIAEQIIRSGADIILAGGEQFLLPKGVIGKHGRPGIRADRKNLIEEARKLGYTVVYTREELLALPVKTERVLGVFSAGHTFNDDTEEALRMQGLPLYNEAAPSIAEMTEMALKILAHKGKEFLLVVEEEGSDNFANKNNAQGALEALRRADAAIGVALHYIEENPHTLLITAADSNAGGLHVMSVRDPADFEKPLPNRTSNGAPLDGRNGKGTLPFLTAPDQFGNRLRFGIAWACYDDVAGVVIAKTHGLNSELLPDTVDNTDIYRIMYATLFGVKLLK